MTEKTYAKITSADLKDIEKQGFNLWFENQRANHSIDKLGHFNIFIGTNNAGKSRLLRAMANLYPQRFAYKINGFDEIAPGLQAMQEDWAASISNHDMYKRVVSFDTQHQIHALEAINFTNYSFTHVEPKRNDQADAFLMLISRLRSPIKINTTREGYVDEDLFKRAISEFVDRHQKLIDIFEQLPKDYSSIPVCYIPIIRSLNDFGIGTGAEEDRFAERIRKNYSLKSNIDIFTGQSIYKRVRSMLLGDQAQRDKIAKYQKFLSDSLFNKEDVVIIPKESSDVVDVKIGSQPERPIFMLGDGIQNLIILTFPLFEYDRVLLFIEEPELNLHPGMQRILLDVLQQKNNHQFFITTHSNHFLDLTIQYNDVSIYSCKRDKQKEICEVRLEAYGDRSILEEIGVQNTSVFLANKTVWVEGITDRLYLDHYLNLYTKHYKIEKIPLQDIDYSFFEYGGGNIVHWSFIDNLGKHSSNSAAKISAKRLCGTMMLIADKDEANMKVERKKILQNELKDNFIELEAREIENLLAPHVIKEVIKGYERGDTKIFDKVSQQDYESELLGNFIDNCFKRPASRKRKAPYADKSGTVNDKVAFAKKAIGHIHNYDDMSPGAKKLTEQIYKFVSS